jgi:hypothetical protein
MEKIYYQIFVSVCCVCGGAVMILSYVFERVAFLAEQMRGKSTLLFCRWDWTMTSVAFLIYRIWFLC